MTASDRAAWTKQLSDEPVALRANKYHAQVCTVDGIRFASRKEARRYEHLKLLQAAGEIKELELQPEFEIVVFELDSVGVSTIPKRPGYPKSGGETWYSFSSRRPVICGRFRADFRYIDAQTGEVVTEDTKSRPTKTEAYRLRKRLVEAIHGVTIREV